MKVYLQRLLAQAALLVYSDTVYHFYDDPFYYDDKPCYGYYGDTTVFTELRNLCYASPMTRIARVVVPGLPHHVTQRGNRRERIFFEDGDYALYRDWLGQSCRRFGVEVWAYCQMPNHVHLILTPEDGEGLALALSRTHRLYAGFVNARARQTGHLFQGRFGSVALDEDHLMNAARYVALNPVRAGLVAAGRGLAAFERARASGGARRRARQGPAAPRPRAAFRRFARERSRRGRLRSASGAAS